MIKHVVIWKLKEKANGNTREENANLIKHKVEALTEKIPVIRHIEVGFDFSGTEHSGDIVLYSEFESREHFEMYRKHPDHMAILPFVTEAVDDRRVVDYEI